MLTHVFVLVLVLVAQTLVIVTAFDCHTQVPEFTDFDIQKVTFLVWLSLRKHLSAVQPPSPHEGEEGAWWFSRHIPLHISEAAIPTGTAEPPIWLKPVA